MRRFVFFLLVLFWATALRGEPVALRAVPVPLNPEAPDQVWVGALAFLAGFDLRVADARFAGWSGLDLADGGTALLAVSDLGHWLSARLHHDRDGRLTGIDNAGLTPLRQPGGAASRSKRDNDAEALRRDRDGSWLVAFELRHRLLRYRPGPDGLPGTPLPVAAPADFADQPANGGAEAIVVLPGGAVVLLSEEGRNAAGDGRGWLRDSAGRWHGLAYRLTEPFRPVDAALLPGGDLLVLERRFTRVGGIGARLVRVRHDTIVPGAVLQGEEVANLAPPLSIDNFEALAVRPAPSGGALVYLLSDDNASPWQRTLLLQFRLD